MNSIKKYFLIRWDKIKRRSKRKLKNPAPYSYTDFCKRLSDSEVSIQPFKDYNYHESEQFPFDISNDQIASKKNVILRHDVDHNPETAYKMAEIENRFKIKSTYFALTDDSSKWWWNDLEKREEYLNLYLKMQNMGHEIALHYDFLGEFFVTGKNPLQNATHILKIFRDFGIKIIGCASHGSGQLRKMVGVKGDLPYPIDYVNYVIWREIKRPPKEIKLNSKTLETPYMSLSDCDLFYESYFVRKDWYISDSGGNFWLGGHVNKKDSFKNLSNLDKDPTEIIKSHLKKGEILQILIHPIWWRNNWVN